MIARPRFISSLNPTSFVVLALGLVTGCNSPLTGPSVSTTGLTVNYSMAGIESGQLGQVFDQVDEIRVTVTNKTAGGELWAGAVPFDRTSEGLKLEPLDVELPEEGVLSVAVDLRWNTSSLFYGTGDVTLTEGTPAESPVISVEPVVSSLEIVPPPTLDQLGATHQVTALLRFATGDIMTDGRPLSWTSSDPTIATIQAETGILQTVREGSTTISASSGGITDQTTLTVGVPVARIVLIPGTAQDLEVGDSVTLSAFALSENGDPLSREIVWSSDDSTVASVSAAGTLQARQSGIALIRAAGGGRFAELSVIVLDAETTLLTLPAVLNAGTATLKGQVPPPGLASSVWFEYGPTIDPTTFQATLVQAGPAGVGFFEAVVSGLASDSTYFFRAVAEFGSDTVVGAVRSFAVSFELPITSIVVVPANPLASVGDTIQFSAVALDSLGQAVTAEFIWTSQDASVGSVDSLGRTTATGEGTTSISASASGLFGTAQLTVTIPPIANISVSPSLVTAAIGDTIVFAATATTAAGDTIGALVTWTSSNDSVATIDAGGSAVLHSTGSVVITASAGAVTGVGNLTVTPLPSVTSESASGVDDSNATLNASFEAMDVGSTGWFEYGLFSDPGTMAATPTQTLTPINGSGSFNGSLGGLVPGTVYYFRGVTKTSGGTTVVGDVLSFTTVALQLTDRIQALIDVITVLQGLTGNASRIAALQAIIDELGPGITELGKSGLQHYEHAADDMKNAISKINDAVGNGDVGAIEAGLLLIATTAIAREIALTAVDAGTNQARIDAAEALIVQGDILRDSQQYLAAADEYKKAAKEAVL